ncbi:hormone-sensitive lipase-like [Haliotis asinina]|uniref:hormone-sensitive lipase-like n=1 Tax=Haliotis asinina TaxID=109174 RepID=UPI0035326E9D
MSLENDNPGRLLSSLIKELKSLALSNIEYFQNGNQSHHAKYHTSFCLLYEYLDMGIEPNIAGLLPRLSDFDVSPDLKGNGYRSLIRIVYKCCLHLAQLLRYIVVNRDSILFRRAHYCKEVEAYVSTIGQLRACLYYANKLINYCQDGNLFADEENLNENIAEQLMEEVEMLNQDCFYGRCLGFQFCDSMQRPLHAVAIAMASFSEGYQENSQVMQLATSLVSSGKYWMNPELRAQQVVYTTRTADVKFCKAFWGITETEIMKSLPSLVCPPVQVNEVISLGPDSFEMPTADGSDIVVITPPCSHTGPGHVQVRLISSILRDGQECHLKQPTKSKNGRPAPKLAPKAPGLLVHCHGGGFVAQSSKSHEVYLRHWAKELNVPILSIDYSLAPEFPFPRALEECFYAYAWATQNCDKLGTTGERICVGGDSAGGNLMISTAMRAAEFGIRCPDGIMAAYTPVLVRYTPSPSRLLCLMDPLLPVGILSRCLAAYAGVSDELASGLASTVFPGDQESLSSIKLKSDESTDTDWVIISQDENAAKTRGPVVHSSQMDQLTPSPCADGVDHLITQTEVLHLNEGSGIVMDSPSPDTFFTPGEGKGEVGFQEVAKVQGESLEDIRLDSPTPVSEGQRICKEIADVLAEDSTQQISQMNLDRDSDTSSGYEILFDKNPQSANGQSNLAEGAFQKGDNSEGQSKQGDNCVSELEGQFVIQAPVLNPNFRMISTPSVDSGCHIEEQMSANQEHQTHSADMGHSNTDANTVDITDLPSSAGSSAQNSPSALRSKLHLNLKKTSESPLKTNQPQATHMHRSASAGVFKTTVNNPGSPTDFLRHRHTAQSPLHAIRRLPIVKNPFMSPLLAPDHMLKGLPHLSLVACHLDPILDDSIMFTKRLRKLGNSVDLHLVDDLPHGFLNFALVCKEAKQASEVCISKLQDMLAPR